MAPTFRSATQDINSTAAANHTANIPVDAATGDLIVVALASNGGTITVPPTGWTNVETEFTQANPKYAVIYRVRQAGDASSVTITKTAVNSTSITVVIQPGAGETLSLDGTPTKANNSTGSNVMTVGAITTTVTNTLLVACQAVNSSTSAQTAPAGMTERQETTGTKKQSVNTQAIAATGSTGTRAGAAASSTLAWAAIMFAVKGVAGGATVRRYLAVL